MKQIAVVVSSVVLGLFGQLAMAQSIEPGYYYQNASVEVSTEAVNLPKVKGVVRRVEAAMNKITIKAEAIPNLDMGPMTMSYVVADPQMLNGIAREDDILFSADEIDGELTVVWIEKQ